MSLANAIQATGKSRGTGVLEGPKVCAPFFSNLSKIWRSWYPLLLVMSGLANLSYQGLYSIHFERASYFWSKRSTIHDRF